MKLYIWSGSNHFNMEGSLSWTDTTLTFRYPAGTLRQRQTLAHTWRITVSAR